jgi:hypothetical protein
MPAQTKEPEKRSGAAPAGPARFAKTDGWKFCLLGLQVLLLLAVLRLYQIEDATFDKVVLITFAAFAIHYWLPFRFKEIFLVLVSLASALYLLGLQNGILLIGVGLLFFGVLRLSIGFRWRALIIACIFAVLIYGNAERQLPGGFPAVFGGIFMFRIMIYMYDLKYSKQPARLLPYLSYFFILPNYCFTLFPVIDFTTMRRSYFQRDIHTVAQQGIQWILRGAIQLALYRVIFYYNDRFIPDRINSVWSLIATMVLTFVMIVRISGQFHIAIGMMHLFGYDLPEAFRRYFLATSFTDFWRRANIYWKDLMVKIFYYPVFFSLRKRGTIFAQVVGTVFVFIVTWALHAYQSFWLAGHLGIRWTDTIFWTLLGALVLGSMLWENWVGARLKRITGWRGVCLQAASMVGTFSTMTFLWFLWSAPSLGRWWFLMTCWKGGR